MIANENHIIIPPRSLIANKYRYDITRAVKPATKITAHDFSISKK